MTSISRLAIILILVIILFALMTQRLMLSTENGTDSPKFEKLSQLLVRRNESFQQARESVKETGDLIWNTISEFTDRASHSLDAEISKDTGALATSLHTQPPQNPSTSTASSTSTSTSSSSTATPAPIIATTTSVDSQATAPAPVSIGGGDVHHAVLEAVVDAFHLADDEEGEGEEEDNELDFVLPEFHPSAASLAAMKAAAASATAVKPLGKTNTTTATKVPTPRHKVKDPELKLIHDLAPALDHPRMSPRPGSDISPAHQLALLKCPNQSKCLVPELQLKVKLKIYLCRHPSRSGIRFYFLTKEGLLLHPNVELVTEEADIDSADFIVYLPGSAPWHLTECTNSSYAKRLLVLDEFDGHTPFYPLPTAQEMKTKFGKNMVWYFMYFKRSFVARMDGRFLRYPMLALQDVYPMTYSVAETYVQNNFNFMREVEILCTLRGSAKMTTRQRVQDWIAEYAATKNISNVITSEVSKEGRKTVDRMYFQHMYNSKIIVTVNPANWEGDFRLWESMASGALIMVDALFVPHQFPLIDGVHVVYFNNQVKDDLFNKLDYYRAHPEEARKIAITGYLHAMKYHRTVSMVDYILRSAHLKRATVKGTIPLPKYVYSGQYLNFGANAQAAAIKTLDRPGIYNATDIMHNHTHLLP